MQTFGSSRVVLRLAAGHLFNDSSQKAFDKWTTGHGHPSVTFELSTSRKSPKFDSADKDMVWHNDSTYSSCEAVLGVGEDFKPVADVSE
jgi:hypothetical protein